MLDHASGVVIGGTVAALLVVTAGLVVCYLRRQRRHKKAQQAAPEASSEGEAPANLSAAQRMEMPEENDTRCSALPSEPQASRGPPKVRGGGLGQVRV